jgi:ribosome recycling factor
MSTWRQQMAGPVKHLEEQLRGIRPGAMSVGFLETFRVSYQGSTVALPKVAAILPGKQTINIRPFDQSLVPAIERTLLDSKLSAFRLNPSTVAVSVPPPSGEQREEMARHVRKLGEEAKIAVRTIRQQARNAAEVWHAKNIQKETDAAIAAIEKAVKSKLAELG